VRNLYSSNDWSGKRNSVCVGQTLLSAAFDLDAAVRKTIFSLVRHAR
jgi:hypothetical protein